MDKELISIIVPAFNADKFIERCINSVLNQTYSEFELILIDDCSYDNTYKICNDYAKRDKRIRLFKLQKNSGVSAARNLGLEVSSGNLLTFIDADDWVEPNYLEFLWKALNTSQADIAYCQYDNKRFKQSKKIKIINTYEYEYHSKYTINSVWGYLFKKKQLVGIKFDETLCYGEDCVFRAQAIINSTKIAYVRQHLYHYTIQSNSLSRGEFKESKLTEFKSWNIIYGLYDGNSRVQESIKVHICSSIFNFLKNYYNNDLFRKKYYNNFLKEYRRSLLRVIKSIVQFRDVFMKLGVYLFPNLALPLIHKLYCLKHKNEN